MREAHEIPGTPQWRDREGRERVSHERWGGDHWSLLARVEGRAVDHHGRIDWNTILVSRRNWPMLWAARNPWERQPPWDAADRYGLRLKPALPSHSRIANILPNHCGADALMDLVDHGLVAIEMPPLSETGRSYLRPDGIALNDPLPEDPLTGAVEWALMPWARFSLTEHGWDVASRLRRFKSRNEYAQFSMPVTVPGELVKTSGS